MKLTPLIYSLSAITLLSAALPAQSAQINYRVFGRPHAEVTKARIVGDIDGDLAQDYLIGSPYAPKIGNVGYCALISGATGSVIREHFGLNDIEHFGMDFSGLHDLNSDGVPEYAIAVPGRVVGSDVGGVVIYDGASGDELREIRDLFVTSRFGDGVLGQTDFTGDGIPDLAVVATKGQKIKVYSGASLLTALGPAFTITTSISGYYNPLRMVRPIVAMPDYDGDGIAEICYNPQGIWGYAATTIYSPATKSAIFSTTSGGYAIPISDTTGDGIQEFAVGDYDYGGYDDPTGEVRVYNGATFDEIWTYNAVYHGWRAHGMGTSIAMIEDLTGDGIPDLATGCGALGRANTFSPAAVLLLDAANGSLLAITGTSNSILANKTLGRNLEAGDIDGDGQRELLVGRPEVHHSYGGFLDHWTGVILACEVNP